METAWLIRLACCLFQHSCSERLDRQKLPAVTQMQYHWLIETGECSWSKAHAGRSHPVVHNASKVYHPMIRLINGTAVEQRTWLKCKYPKCKWLNWITGNYKVFSWDLSDFANGSVFCEHQGRFSPLKRLRADNKVSCDGASAHSCRRHRRRISFIGQACIRMLHTGNVTPVSSLSMYSRFQEPCSGRGKHKPLHSKCTLWVSVMLRLINFSAAQKSVWKLRLTFNFHTLSCAAVLSSAWFSLRLMQVSLSVVLSFWNSVGKDERQRSLLRLLGTLDVLRDSNMLLKDWIAPGHYFQF